MKIIYILLIVLTGCSTATIPFKERYEGIKKNNLRVYIKNDLSVFPNNISTEHELKREILSLAKKRTFQLIDNYITISRPELKAQSGLYQTIEQILKTGKIYYCIIDDDRHNFEAYIDYDIKPILPSTSKHSEKKVVSHI